MGLFSSKKKIFVSSSVMNLGGSDDQSKFVPTTIVGGAIANERQLGQYFISQLLGGQGVKLRAFYRWARRTGYSNTIGLNNSVFYVDIAIDKEKLSDVLNSVIPINRENQYIELDEATIDWFDIQWIGDNWTSVNRPDLMGMIESIDIFNTPIGEHLEKRKEFAGYDNEGGKEYKTVFVTVIDYRQDIQIKYTNGESVVITKTDYDEKARYLYINYRIITFKLVEIPGDPKPDIPAVDGEGNPILDKDGNQVMIPQPPDPPTYVQEVIKEEPRFIAYGEGGSLQYYNQFFNSGSAMEGTYFPYIPYRHDNKWLSEEHMPDIYTWAKKAYRKLNGKNKYNGFIEQLKKSEGIEDCQFIYQQMGVSINTAWMPGKKYIFEFFYNIYLNESISIENNKVPVNESWDEKLIRLLGKKNKSIFIKSDHGVCNFSNRINWGEMKYSLHNGKIFPGAKKNKYRIYRDKINYKYVTYTEGNEGDLIKHHFSIDEHFTIMEHQISANRFERLRISNLTNDNIIYGGKAVTYNAYDELANAGDEVLDDITAGGESGFIVPLEYSSFKEIGLVNDTDLSRCSQYLVCNSYVVKKIRWYQRGIFKVVMLVVAVVMAVWTGGASLAEYLVLQAGLTAAAATAAAVAIITVFTIAMSLLIIPMMLKVFTKMFGQIIGTIVTAICAIIISFNFTNAFQATTTTIWSSLCTISNVMTLASAALEGVAKYLNESAQTFINRTNDIATQMQEKLNEVDEMTRRIFGSNSLVNMDMVYKDMLIPEPPASFLSRTLMTGADNANMSLDMIYNFPTYTLSLSNPITS